MAVSVSWNRRGTGWVLRLEGVLDETLDRDELAGDYGGFVLFDLDGVNRVTSFGVREWIAALRRLETSYYGFVRCRPSLVSQFNMVAGFGGEGELLSLYAPYVCVDCEEIVEALVDVVEEYGALVEERLPVEMSCPACGGRAELDELPDEYFAYVRSKPKPRLPPDAHALLYGTEQPSVDRLTVRKEIEGIVTTVWLRGPLDAQARLRRQLEGIQGQCVVELSCAGPITADGIDHLMESLRAGSTQTVSFARVPLSALPIFERQWQDIELGVVSVLVHAPCALCGFEPGVDVDVTDLDVTREVACPGCGVAEKIAPFEAAAAAPPSVRVHLRRRPPGSIWHRTQVGTKYEPIARLGAGGMAEVFLARQHGPEGFQKDVVLKRILPDLSVNPQFTDLFLQEARLAAGVSHPNVIQIFDLGRDADGFYIAMEYVKGWDLRELLRAAKKGRGRVPWPIACRVIADICAGLQAAHRGTDPDGRPLCIVHGDVSPQNILVSADGVVKIADFGVARVTSSLVPDEEGSFRGKYAYASPEQIQGLDALVGPPSDIFAAGIVLYECLAGRHPFRQARQVDTMRAIVLDVPPQLSTEGMPPQLSAVIEQALAKDPVERQASAADLAMQLETLLLELRTPTTPTQVAEYVQVVMGISREVPIAFGGRESGSFSRGAVESQLRRIGEVGSADDEETVVAVRFDGNGGTED